MNQHNTQDGLRMMGHLLEHHPTTYAYARNKSHYPVSGTNESAVCWCLVGASQAVAKVLNISSVGLRNGALKALWRDSGTNADLVNIWDSWFSTWTHAQIVERLKSA